MIPIDAIILLELFQGEGAAADLLLRVSERTNDQVVLAKPTLHRRLRKMKADGLITSAPRALVKGGRCYGNHVYKLSPAGRTQAEHWRKCFASLLGIQDSTPSSIILPNRWGGSIWRWFMGRSPAGFDLLEPTSKLWGPAGVPVILGARLHGLPLIELVEDTPLELVPPGTSLHAGRVLRGQLDRGDVFQTQDEFLEDPPEETSERIEEVAQQTTEAIHEDIRMNLRLP